MGKTIGKSFAIGMLIVGAFMGAGFASGAEILAFFTVSAHPALTAFLVALFVFGTSALFLFIGSKTNAKTISEVNTKLVGKFHFLTDAFLLVNSLIILAGMLAAFDSLGNRIFPVRLSPLYSIAIGLLAVAISVKGMKGLIVANKIISPTMIIALLFITVFTIFSFWGERVVSHINFRSFYIVIVYVCMNIILASTVITTLGKINKKTIFLSSGIAAVSIGGLVLTLLMALRNAYTVGGEMPVLDMARFIHPAVYWIMVVILAAGIFTTILTAMCGLVAWFSKIFKSKLFSGIVVLILGFILSNLGFSTVVAVLYPIIGVLGILYTILGLVFVIRVGRGERRERLGESWKPFFCKKKVSKPSKKNQ